MNKLKNDGMTLRDWFAGRAMQALISQSMGTALQSDLDTGAQYAYRMADAMLKEREVEPRQHATHPAITHCDNCGCDWLDNGLNPVGCPYCKQNAWQAAFISERTMRYLEGGMAIEQARIHAETETAFISKQCTNKEAPDND